MGYFLLSALHVGPHSVVVVYIDRAVAALALPAVTANIGAPPRSRSGTLALAFALALTFTNGRLSSTGELETLQGGSSRPPEVLLPELAGRRPVAPSPADAAGMPPGLGTFMSHLHQSSAFGVSHIYWGDVHEGIRLPPCLFVILSHNCRGVSCSDHFFPPRRTPPPVPPSRPWWTPGVPLPPPHALTRGSQTHVPLPTRSFAT